MEDVQVYPCRQSKFGCPLLPCAGRCALHTHSYAWCVILTMLAHRLALSNKRLVYIHGASYVIAVMLANTRSSTVERLGTISKRAVVRPSIKIGPNCVNKRACKTRVIVKYSTWAKKCAKTLHILHEDGPLHTCFHRGRDAATTTPPFHRPSFLHVTRVISSTTCTARGRLL